MRDRVRSTAALARWPAPSAARAAARATRMAWCSAALGRWRFTVRLPAQMRAQVAIAANRVAARPIAANAPALSASSHRALAIHAPAAAGSAAATRSTRPKVRWWRRRVISFRCRCGRCSARGPRTACNRPATPIRWHRSPRGPVPNWTACPRRSRLAGRRARNGGRSGRPSSPPAPRTAARIAGSAGTSRWRAGGPLRTEIVGPDRATARAVPSRHRLVAVHSATRSPNVVRPLGPRTVPLGQIFPPAICQPGAGVPARLVLFEAVLTAGRSSFRAANGCKHRTTPRLCPA